MHGGHCDKLAKVVGQSVMPSVRWHCWLGGRKGIRPVKTEWWGAGMVICLERGADLPSWCHCHSLSLASVKSRLVLPFWYRLTRVVPEKGSLNGGVSSVKRRPSQALSTEHGQFITLSVSHCRTQMTIHCDDRRAVAKFSKSRLQNKVPGQPG